MTMRMAAVGGQFLNISENLGWFRRHTENMSAKIKGTIRALKYAENKAMFDKKRAEYLSR
jgi:hypothetical protein